MICAAAIAVAWLGAWVLLVKRMGWADGYVGYGGDTYGKWDRSEWVFHGSLVALGAAGIGIAASFALGQLSPHVVIPQGSSPIASIEQDQTMRGSFFIGTGSIESRPVFFVYEQAGDGYALTNYPADRTTIVEGDDAPRVDRQFIGREAAQWWLLDGGVNHYVIHVPHGTLTRNFGLGPTTGVQR